MKRRPAPIDIAALKKVITLDPKRKNICTVCRQKMRPPSAAEDPTPTCDNCAHDLVIDTLPKLLDELETARAAASKPAKKPRKKPVAKKRGNDKEATREVARAVVEEVREALAPEPEHASGELPKPASEPEHEVDEATDVSELALALEEDAPAPKPRRRVQFVPATPQEVQAKVIQLRERFEK